MKLRMGELARESGIPRTTIHYYLREGLLHQPYRTSRTTAYYDESHVRRLRRIRRIKEDALRRGGRSRVPLDFLKVRIEEESQESAPRGSKARRQQRGEAGPTARTRERIIQAALKLYGDRGFYQTHVRDIVKEVGISPPTFYHYYPDKRELFVDVIEHLIRGFREELGRALEDERNLVKRSILMFRFFSEHYPRLGEVLNQLRAGAIARDEWARERLARVYRELTKDLAAELERLIRRGLVRDMDPELLAYFLIAIAEAEMHRATLDDQHTIEELAAFAGDLQFNGLLTARGREVMGISGGDRRRKPAADESVRE
jgi:AcrR family transcriptional regulator